MAELGDFYEEDEPIEDVVAAFEHGEKITPGVEFHWSTSDNVTLHSVRPGS